MQPIRRLLICRSDRIGDVILTLPLFAAARRAFPGVHISALVSPLTAPLLESHPDVDDVIIDDDKADENGPRAFMHLVEQLRRGSFDTALMPFCNWRIAMAAAGARIPRRVANGLRLYRPFINRPVFLHRSHPPMHEADFALAFLTPLGIKPDKAEPPRIHLTDDEIMWAADFLAEKGIPHASSAIGLHPGSSGSAYNVSPDRWVRYAGLAADQLECNHILVTGTPSELPLAERIMPALGSRAVNATGQLSLRQLCAVQSHLSLVLAPSTGPLHTAAAGGTPVLGFYPPRLSMSQAKWRPLGDRVRILTPRAETCTKCKPEDCPWFPCMDQFTDSQVIAVLDELLREMEYREIEKPVD